MVPGTETPSPKTQALARAFQRATAEKLYALPVAGTDRAGGPARTTT